jgi:hypothetical protein
MSIEVGDKVQYTPHQGHALDRDAFGDYPWVLGKKIGKFGKPGDLSTEVVTELQGKKLGEHLEEIRRAPDPAVAMRSLVYLRPRCHWSATVRAVHEEDGTVDIDVSHPNGSILHYDHVKVETTLTEPRSHHSCHKE